MNILRGSVPVVRRVLNPAILVRAHKGETSILGMAYPGEKSLPPSRRPSGAGLAVMTSDAHLKELGEFLEARRAGLSPRTVGLPDTGGPRRVAGLRREEVALLAAISTDYCTRLEQGRIKPSASALAALSHVLHLDDHQRGHLHRSVHADAVRGLEGRRPYLRVPSAYVGPPNTRTIRG